MIYDPRTGEFSVDAPDGMPLAAINISSASGIFVGEAAEQLGAVSTTTPTITSLKPRLAAASVR